MAFDSEQLAKFENKKNCQSCGTPIYQSAVKCRFCGDEQKSYDYLAVNIILLIFEKAVWIVVSYAVIYIAYSFLNQDFDEVDDAFTGIGSVFETWFFIFMIFAVLESVPKVCSTLFDKVPSPSTVLSYRDQKKWLKRIRKLCLIIVSVSIILLVTLHMHRPTHADFQEFVETNTDYEVTKSFVIEENGVYSTFAIEQKDEGIYYIGFWNVFFEIPASYIW